MKRLFPIALLVCAFFTMSGFSVLPVGQSNLVKAAVKPTENLSWPITGSTQSSLGTVTYSISGSGTTPSYIVFYSGSNVYGPYTWTQDSNGQWSSTGMYAALNISGVILGFPNSSTYNIEFISIY
ncbi:hypothetical protein [Chitinophaga sp.]|uniref:hypothetical protein n=1 Tax=Chitinophaga sp. TaxID=1869181 RepID=UPI0031D8BF7B